MRVDARRLLAGASGVVALAIPYLAEDALEERGGDPVQCGDGDRDKQSRALISRYARFDDYHAVIKEKLNRMLDEIRDAFPGVDGLCCVDDRPIMEKSFAAAAGVGFVGKNTLLITKEHGSYVFLGEIILNAHLPSGTQMDDGCGSCDKCIRACPTQALVEPYVLDARRCISYLTKDSNDGVPQELEPSMGAWVFGCDVCQEACPYNAKRKPVDLDGRFAPRSRLVNPSLDELLEHFSADLSCSDARIETRRRFEDLTSTTPVSELGVERFLENLSRAKRNYSPCAFQGFESAQGNAKVNA